MSRPLRIEYPGALYHLTGRGNRRQAIFLGDHDRRLFLDLLAEAVDRYRWLCHAYCLMDNHYHLLVQTPLANLGRGMRHLNGVYTQRFNRAHGRVGHVFQGRYGAILIEQEPHLLEVARYVVLNPQRAGLADVTEWPWSSYRATAGLAEIPAFLHTEWLLAQFGPGTERARRAYRRYVGEGEGKASPWEGAASPEVLGGEAFLATTQALAATDSEVPRAQRYLVRPTLAELQRQHTVRGAWMAAAFREHGYTLRDIAAASGLHYSSASKIVSAWEREHRSTFKT